PPGARLAGSAARQGGHRTRLEGGIGASHGRPADGDGAGAALRPPRRAAPTTPALPRFQRISRRPSALLAPRRLVVGSARFGVAGAEPSSKSVARGGAWDYEKA